MVICLQGNVKAQNTEKRPFMAHFESNKQTQKCYVTEWVKRNAVIKQRLCLCAAHKRTISPDLFPSVPVWWTVNVAIVKLTASFSGAGHTVRRLVEAGHRFQTIPPQCLVRNCARNVIQPAIFIIFSLTVIRIRVFVVFFLKKQSLLCGRRDCRESLLL